MIQKKIISPIQAGRGVTGFLFLVLLGIAQCKPAVKKPDTIVQTIQQTGQLVTAEYTLQKMVKASDNRTWYKVGDRRILLSIEAVVKAGIDLQQVSRDDITLHDSVLKLQLPRPEIFSVSIPPSKIQVKLEDVDFLRSRFSAAEREALLRQAESQVRRLADSLGILQTAETNAATFLRRLLLPKGFRDVQIAFKK